MKIIITAATHFEVAPAYQQVNIASITSKKYGNINFHVSGVGMLAAAFSFTRLLMKERPDIIIQAGIAGAFDTNISLGNTVAVKEELLGDTGVEENGIWKDIFDLKLVNSDAAPFEQKKLINPYLNRLNLLNLMEIRSVTVNEITTNPLRIQQLKNKYDPCIESMEGASLHYVCNELSVPYIQLRSISNYVGERDKSKWKMKEAIINLNQMLLQLVERLISEHG